MRADGGERGGIAPSRNDEKPESAKLGIDAIRMVGARRTGIDHVYWTGRFASSGTSRLASGGNRRGGGQEQKGPAIG
jgi:hypothetical protein